MEGGGRPSNCVYVRFVSRRMPVSLCLGLGRGGVGGPSWSGRSILALESLLGN